MKRTAILINLKPTKEKATWNKYIRIIKNTSKPYLKAFDVFFSL